MEQHDWRVNLSQQFPNLFKSCECCGGQIKTHYNGGELVNAISQTLQAERLALLEKLREAGNNLLKETDFRQIVAGYAADEKVREADRAVLYNRGVKATLSLLDTEIAATRKQQ